jgi:large repetitive protein
VTKNTVTNNPPTASGTSFSVRHDTTYQGYGLLSTASDPDNDSLTAACADGRYHGSATVYSDGSFTYTPAEHFAGEDSFTFTAYDGMAYSDPATATINVTNAAASASSDSYSTPHNVTLNGSGVVSNDYDPDGG